MLIYGLTCCEKRALISSMMAGWLTHGHQRPAPFMTGIRLAWPLDLCGVAAGNFGTWDRPVASISPFGSSVREGLQAWGDSSKRIVTFPEPATLQQDCERLDIR